MYFISRNIRVADVIYFGCLRGEETRRDERRDEA